jgi:glutamine amidotransferase
MCRHLAYVGRPVVISSLVFDAPRSLRTQARTPDHQPPGRINPDGWGVAWYPDHKTPPEEYRSTTSIWDDDTFTDATTCSRAIVAAARLASPGTALDSANNAPFVSSRWSFSLNGFGFHDDREATLRAALSPERRAALRGDTDSEVIFGLVLDRVDDGLDPASALRDVTALVDPGDRVRLNLLLSDGATVAATAWGNSLFVRPRDDSFLVASEPLDDDPAWARVPDRSLVDGPHLSPLGGSR